MSKDWFEELSEEAQQKYLEDHPRSRKKARSRKTGGMSSQEEDICRKAYDKLFDECSLDEAKQTVKEVFDFYRRRQSSGSFRLFIDSLLWSVNSKPCSEVLLGLLDFGIKDVIAHKNFPLTGNTIDTVFSGYQMNDNNEGYEYLVNLARNPNARLEELETIAEYDNFNSQAISEALLDNDKISEELEGKALRHIWSVCPTDWLPKKVVEKIFENKEFSKNDRLLVLMDNTDLSLKQPNCNLELRLEAIKELKRKANEEFSKEEMDETLANEYLNKASTIVDSLDNYKGKNEELVNLAKLLV